MYRVFCELRVLKYLMCGHAGHTLSDSRLHRVSIIRSDTSILITSHAAWPLVVDPVKLFKLYRVYAPVDSLICSYLFSVSSTFNTILLILYTEPTPCHSIRQYQKAKTNSLSSPSPRNIPRLMQRKLNLAPRGVEAADTVADMC